MVFATGKFQRARRSERYAVLAAFDFFWYANDHVGLLFLLVRNFVEKADKGRKDLFKKHPISSSRPGIKKARVFTRAPNFFQF